LDLEVYLFNQAGQVRSFFIETTDHIILGAWHILPLCLIDRPKVGMRPTNEFSDDGSSKLKNADRVFLYFHGNAGNRATFHRTSFYKMMTGLSGRNHVIAIDYRGFGNSTPAVPTEATVRIDARSSYDWIIDQGVHPTKIFICGHSLGSGVATDLAYNVSTCDHQVCGGLIIVSGYASIADAAIGYPMVPLLRPFHGFPRMEAWIKTKMVDKWLSHRKMRDIKVPILILHGKKDFEIRPWQAQALFYEAMGGRAEQNYFPLSDDGFWELRGKEEFNNQRIDMVITTLAGDEGELWSFDEQNPIWLLQVSNGGHNTMSIHQIVDDTIESWLASIPRRSMREKK
jgi:abhydrolase domain-containing protein 12